MAHFEICERPMKRVALASTRTGTRGVVEHRPLSKPDQRAFLGLQERARIERANDAIVRVCMIGFGVAIAAIAPVTWGWKIALFVVIMFLVGVVMPAIWRARKG